MGINLPPGPIYVALHSDLVLMSLRRESMGFIRRLRLVGLITCRLSRDEGSHWARLRLNDMRLAGDGMKSETMLLTIVRHCLIYGTMEQGDPH